jgi:two-component system, OmpR family, phosphate regulon sensor histidine kinase PhoR
MTSDSVYLIVSDPEISRLLDHAIRPAGYAITIINDFSVARELIKANPPSLVIVGEQAANGDSMKIAEKLHEHQPNLPVLFLPDRHSVEIEVQALRSGYVDYLSPPVHSQDVLDAISRALQRKNRVETWVRLEWKRNTKTLQKRIDGLETLQRIGQSVTSLLDLDSVLKAVVDSAVELTGAEEGSLLLLDETSGDLYMHAARNFNEDFVRTFRLPVTDTLAGEVLRSGAPMVIDEKEPRKIKTSYHVHTLIYVPLKVHDRVIGVLGVDKRRGGHPFEDTHFTLVSALADYAAIAIENARLYSHTDVERKKLETILTHIDDGVLVVDDDLRVVLLNQMARSFLQLNEGVLIGQPVDVVVQQSELLELLLGEKRMQPRHAEIVLEEGRVLNAQLTPIPGVGLAVTMQDITQLKELDRVKSDFVNTVSHDLRSPLTAILGYVELIERAGPVNDQQREFIRRVQFSVNNITSLINDLLDLGRIEAGFDVQKELVSLPSIIRYAIEGLRHRIEDKRLTLQMDIDDQLSNVLGNPVRLRQMVANLVGNAVQYTGAGGNLHIDCQKEEGQAILRVSDTGIGIPSQDQPYIFDKFYRASNIPLDSPGTGLGLAIVRSIVENHQGRIWVDSTIDAGTTFTVVFPFADKKA